MQTVILLVLIIVIGELIKFTVFFIFGTFPNNFECFAAEFT